VVNPRNPAIGGITVVAHLDPLPLKVRDLRLALNLIEDFEMTPENPTPN